MSKRFYPAVLERAEGGMFAVWFPDFPGCVAAGRSQEEAAARAEDALAAALQEAAENETIPEPTAFDAIITPVEAEVVTLLSIGASPPSPSERVNVYLPKNLIARADAMAEEWGMSRSSFFGLALTRMLTIPTGVVTEEVPPSRKKGRKP
jgi:predicted RNase H-like HicB family nuclease